MKSISFYSVCAIVIALFGSICAQVDAAVYYVDSVGGSDGNAGTSPGAAWQNLTKVSSTTFSAGDQILFKCGGTWSGQLWPKGSGSAGNPIVIDKYDTGNLPLIQGPGTNLSCAVYLYNQEYWEIRNLEITNQSGSADPRRGVYVLAEDVGAVHHIYLTDLVVHDVDGAVTSNKIDGGIYFEVSGSSVETWYEDFLVEGCYIYDVNTIGVSSRSSWKDRSFTDDDEWVPSLNVVIRNNLIERSGKNGAILRCTDDALIEYNIFKKCSLHGSGNANYPFNCDDTIIQYNESYLTQWESGTPDASGFDSDYRCKNTIIQYNYSHDNDRGFCLITCMGGGTRFNDGTIVRYNISENDGAVGTDDGQIIRMSGTTTNSYIYNNVFYIPAGSSTRILWHKSWSGWSDGTYYYNNIIYNLGDGIYDFGSSTNNTFDYNVFYGNHPASEPADAHKLTSDPNFINPGSGAIGLDTVYGYMLRPGSACIDSGMTIAGNGGLDYWGNTVPFNTLTDRGAHEYSPLEGDFEQDGDVDNDDMQTFVGEWVNSCTGSGWCGGCDIDQSGIVDFNDFNRLAENWRPVW